MSSLALKYSRDPNDDFALLFVSVETANFKGTVSFWVQWQDVEDLGSSLKAYPIELEAPITASWGFNQCIGDDLIIDLHIAQADARGTLLVRAELADQHDRSQRLKASFRSDYSCLDSFGREVRRMMKCDLEEAVLLGL
jgi:hypothetical protein